MKTDYFEIIEGKQQTSEILTECKKLFNVWSFFDEKRIDKDFPPPKKIGTRYFAKNVEADEAYKNKSAQDLEKEGGKFITLRERLLMELDYFKETGNHLDIENWTLCAGSRYADGSVPDVRWCSYDRGLYVHWCSVDNRYPSLRARAAVIPSDLKLEPLGSDLEARVERLEAFEKQVRGFLILP
jgi:hypothetical protein